MSKGRPGPRAWHDGDRARLVGRIRERGERGLGVSWLASEFSYLGGKVALAAELATLEARGWIRYALVANPLQSYRPARVVYWSGPAAGPARKTTAGPAPHRAGPDRPELYPAGSGI